MEMAFDQEELVNEFVHPKQRLLLHRRSHEIMLYLHVYGTCIKSTCTIVHVC